MAKSQFQSGEKMEVRFSVFINRNDGSEITGDTVILYVRCPDCAMLDSVTNPTDIPPPAYLSDVGYWWSDIPTAVRTAHGAGTYLWKAVSNNANAMTQRKCLNWGDYVDQMLDAKNAADAAKDSADLAEAAAADAYAAASSADAKCTTIQAKTDNLPATPADEATLTTLGLTLTTVHTNVLTLKKVQTGRWRVSADNQFLIYDTDGVTVLYRFDVKDLAGLPTSDNIYERVPV